MKCPACGTPDAYVGLTKVECPNPACVHWDSKEREKPPSPSWAAGLTWPGEPYGYPKPGS